MNREVPKPPSLLKMIGPSFILLGLGLGSGELILWPFLTSRYGLGLMWGAVLGITFQFFINMEIERYTLITGESVFVGLSRKLGRFSPLWFIISTIIPWMWPGIIASSAVVIAFIIGKTYSPNMAIILLLIIGLSITLSPIIYKLQEKFQKYLILIGVPAIIILAFYLSSKTSLSYLIMGVFGKGEGFWFLPSGISIASFLGAFAYSGAGGNLNLAQSFYIKEKGYGMGKYSGRITSILTGKKEAVKLEGQSFEINENNLKRFKKWWKRINLEHAIVFWATGAFTMLILSLMAYSTVYKHPNLNEGVGFLFNEAAVISQKTIPIIGSIFLIITALMLFSTQFTLMDATSRILSENLIIAFKNIFKVEKLRNYYFIFLWTLIILGILVLKSGFNQPINLVILGAFLNAVTMFFYSGLVLWLNLSQLNKELRPKILRSLIVSIATLFYGSFTVLTIFQYLK